MKSDSQFSLFGLRRFGPFFLSQLFGALNDNIFRNALVILIVFNSASSLAFDTNTIINLCIGLFILPFFLFSALAGQLSDKYEKSQLMQKFKLFELAIMLGVAVGFYLQNTTLLIGMLFLMGLQSTLFGPVKYAILPQHLKEDELIGGNALVETGTFMAILIGTNIGGILVGIPEIGTTLVSVVIVVLAVLGYLSSRYVPLAPPMDPYLRINWNPFTETWRIFKFTKDNRTVFLSILGISWFWFLGSIYLSQLPNYTRLTLTGNEGVVTVLLTLFSVGIGIGSLLCERLSSHKVEIGLVPLGSIGLTLFGIDLYFSSNGSFAATELLGAREFVTAPGSTRIMLDIMMLGVFGGLYTVPLYSLIQHRSDPAHRARTIACNNIINALFMVVSSGMAIGLLALDISIPELFLITAILNALVAIYIYRLVPEFLMRFIVWLLIHSVYRVYKAGLEKIPAEGPAVLVCNHVSYVDSLVIAACIHRPVRFVAWYKFYRLPILNFVFRTAQAIPIASRREDPALLEAAYDKISAELEAGNLVCIFPEGKLTKTGEMNPFQPGLKKIIERNPVPVIPMALRGLWGSAFSHKEGNFILTMLRRFWSRVELVTGNPINPENIRLDELHDTVLAMRGDFR